MSILLMWVCATGWLSAQSAPAFRQQPTIIANPNPAVPLAAILRFTPSTRVTTRVTIHDGTRRWQVEFLPHTDPSQGLPLIGFVPGSRNEILVSIRDAAGNETKAAKPLSFTAPTLPTDPEEFPPIQVKTADAAKMEPGWTILSVRRQRRGGGGGGGGGRPAGAPPAEPVFATSYGLILALDEHGAVRWFYRSSNRTADVHRLRNGNIAFLTNDSRLVEVDLLGNVQGDWCASRRPNGPCTSTPVDALTMHHTFEELPNGNFLVLSGELREIDNYYASETDPHAPRKRQKVMGDQLIEFDRTGKVVWRWKAFDHLDPFRLGYLTINQYWNIRGFTETLDWTHGNGVFHIESDDSVLFNSRQQSSVVKIERPSGRIQWIFGEPGGWPDRFQNLLFNGGGPTQWPWHHHAASITPRGTLMMFNNGIYQNRPFHGPTSDTVSGALEYAIDTKLRTANLVWSSDAEGGDAITTFAMGDAAMLPKTGNVMVVYGSGQRKDNQLPASGVREFLHTTPPKLIYEVVLADKSEKPPLAWIAFGGDRVQKLQ